MLDMRPVGFKITVRNLTLMILTCQKSQCYQNLPRSWRHVVIMLRLLRMEGSVTIAAFDSCYSCSKRAPVCVLWYVIHGNIYSLAS
jgi:hypothetical protein